MLQNKIKALGVIVVGNYGFLSLIPPILAIGLAVVTKEVFVSLMIGCFVGAVFVCGWNPFSALNMLILDYFFPQMSDAYNAQAFFLMAVVGGFAALLAASGGALAFTKNKTMQRIFAKNRSRAEIGTWLGGIFIWFSDTSSSLIVGPVFDNINSVNKVSREKFSYILDCTASPVSSLVPIMGWGVYIMSLVDKELASTKTLDITAWDLFIQAIPFCTYSILTLLMCGFMAWSQWDYGPMLKAQLRASKLGKLNSDTAVPMRKTRDLSLPAGVEPKLITLILPLSIVLICIFTILPMYGFPYQPVGGSKIRSAVAYGFILAEFSLCIMLPKLKIMSFKECIKTITDGMSGMMYMCIVLLMAWTLGALCKTMGTAPYLVGITKDLLSPALLPSLIFIAGAAVSFATGTSWGTYAIFIPIIIPMAAELNIPLPLCLAATISGGLLGDHCSPISDTTIIAAMAAGADLVDHFETQMPYAFLIGSICTVLYALNSVFSAGVTLVLGIISIVSLTYILHKRGMKKYSKQFE